MRCRGETEEVVRGGRISGRNHRHQVTRNQKMDARRAAGGIPAEKVELGSFLSRRTQKDGLMADVSLRH